MATTYHHIFEASSIDGEHMPIAQAAAAPEAFVFPSTSPVMGSRAFDPGADCPVELNLTETRLGPLTYWFSKLLVVLPIALGIFGNLIVYKIMKHPGFTNKTFR